MLLYEVPAPPISRIPGSFWAGRTTKAEDVKILVESVSVAVEANVREHWVSDCLAKS